MLNVTGMSLSGCKIGDLSAGDKGPPFCFVPCRARGKLVVKVNRTVHFKGAGGKH